MQLLLGEHLGGEEVQADAGVQQQGQRCAARGAEQGFDDREHAHQVSEEQCQLGGQPRIVRAALEMRNRREQDHEHAADRHQPRFGQQLCQCTADRDEREAADPGGAPVRTLAFAAFALQPDQQADAEGQQQPDHL